MQQNNLRILNVDVNDSSRAVNTAALGSAGFEVIEAASGHEAVASMERVKPALVVLNTTLSDVSSPELRRRIGDIPEARRIPVLRICAPDDAHRDHELGSDAILVQPVREAELVAAVNNLLRLARLEEALQQTAEWEQMADAVSWGVALLDRDGKVKRCNRAFAAFLNTSAGEAAGQGCAVLFTNRGYSLEDGFFSPPRECGARQAEIATPQNRTAEVCVERVYNEAGEPEGSVCLITDVTQRVRSVAQLEEEKELLERSMAQLPTMEKERAEMVVREQQARRAAEEANRIKDEFLATVSHELRTPLNSILGWATLLRSGKLDEGAAGKALDTIERNAKAQSKLLDDLLDAARIVSGKLHLELTGVDLGDVLEHAVEAARPVAEAKSISLETVCEPGAFPVRGDGHRLEQIFGNLLSNAVKFTPERGRIEVRLYRSEGSAQVSVSDTGIGMDADFISRAFEGFRQADASTSRSYGGLGLGLAIVRTLVERHGGHVRAESPGQGLGSTFTVDIPLLDQSDASVRHKRRHNS